MQHDPYPSHGPFCWCGCRRWISSQRQPSMTKLQLEVGQVYDSKLAGFISLFLIYLMSCRFILHLVLHNFHSFGTLPWFACFRGLVAQVCVGFPRFFTCSGWTWRKPPGAMPNGCKQEAYRAYMRGKLLSSDIIVTALDHGWTCLPGRINLSQGNFARLEVWVPTVGSPRTTLCSQVLLILLILFILFGLKSRGFEVNNPWVLLRGPWRSSPSRTPKSVARILRATRNGMARILRRQRAMPIFMA